MALGAIEIQVLMGVDHHQYRHFLYAASVTVKAMPTLRSGEASILGGAKGTSSRQIL